MTDLFLDESCYPFMRNLIISKKDAFLKISQITGGKDLVSFKDIDLLNVYCILKYMVQMKWIRMLDLSDIMEQFKNLVTIHENLQIISDHFAIIPCEERLDPSNPLTTVCNQRTPIADLVCLSASESAK